MKGRALDSNSIIFREPSPSTRFRLRGHRSAIQWDVAGVAFRLGCNPGGAGCGHRLTSALRMGFAVSEQPAHECLLAFTKHPPNVAGTVTGTRFAPAIHHWDIPSAAAHQPLPAAAPPCPTRAFPFSGRAGPWGDCSNVAPRPLLMGRDNHHSQDAMGCHR